MILRSARAARGRRSGWSQLVYVCGSHGYGGLDGAGMELVFGWHEGQSQGVRRISKDSRVHFECEVIN